MKAKNFTKQRRKTSLLHTLSHKCLKSFDFIILLYSIAFLLCKASWHAEGRCQVLGVVNPVVDSDFDDNGIFHQERSLSGVFNTFLNHWCVKKDKNIF